jgi:DNA-binding NarL/FixJ family response regulator
MQPNRGSARGEARRLRVVLVDDHAISRAACRALLRTEGVDVVADLAVDDAAIAAVDGLLPSAVIIDVTPGRQHGLQLATRLRTLPRAPIVLLTSSADRAMLDAGVDGFPFLAKAGLCREAIFQAIRPGRHAPPTDYAREAGHPLTDHGSHEGQRARARTLGA